MGISNLTGKCLSDIKKSILSDHGLDSNCLKDFDHFDILPQLETNLDFLLRKV